MTLPTARSLNVGMVARLPICVFVFVFGGSLLVIIWPSEGILDCLTVSMDFVIVTMASGVPSDVTACYVC